MNTSRAQCGRVWPWLLLIVVVAAATAGVTALLLNVAERKAEGRQPFMRLVEVTEDTTDPEVWGTNWPKQYDGYKLTAQRTATRFGGHGGSEALPAEKIERDPWLKRMFADQWGVRVGQFPIRDRRVVCAYRKAAHPKTAPGPAF